MCACRGDISVLLFEVDTLIRFSIFPLPLHRVPSSLSLSAFFLFGLKSETGSDDGSVQHVECRGVIFQWPFCPTLTTHARAQTIGLVVS